MSDRYFAAGSDRDIAADFAAMSKLARDIHGVHIPFDPAAPNPIYDAVLKQYGFVPGEELTCACAFLSAAQGTGAFDALLASKVTNPAQGQPYRINVFNLETNDPDCGDVSIIEHEEAGQWFAVAANEIELPTSRIMILMAEEADDDVFLFEDVTHESVRSCLWRFLIRQHPGENSSLIDGFEDFDGMMAAATAAYGPPAELCEDHYIFEAPNLFVELSLREDWMIHLWIVDPDKPFHVPQEIQAQLRFQSENLNRFANLTT